MTQQPQEAPVKKFKPKNWAQINGNCKMAKLSDGYAPKACPVCSTVHKCKICRWCGYVRGKK